MRPRQEPEAQNAFFLNPVFTSGPIRERLELGRIAPGFQWAVVAGIGACALLSSAGAPDAFYRELIAGAVAVGLAALTLRYLVTSVVSLNDKRMTKAAPGLHLH